VGQLKIKLIIIISYLFLIQSSGMSENPDNTLRFGLSAGRVDVSGYYRDRISKGYAADIFVNYTFFNNRLLLLESNLSYADLSLKESRTSKFNYYSFSLGPVLYYSDWRYLKPYSGISASINYFELTAIKTSRNEHAVKPGAVIKAGTYIPVYNKISINLGVKYSVNEISGKAFGTINCFAGALYAFEILSKEKTEQTVRQLETDEYYESGLKCFNAGDGMEAKEYFKKVILYSNNYKDVKNYLEIINSNEEKYSRALNSISENNLYEALPLLIDSEKYIIDARKKLNEIRQKLILLNEDKNNADKGIEAYNNNDYEKCIFYMKRAHLINPDNETAGIYLPRAIQRKNALQKIE
jgi:hypothetical protein